MKRPDNPIPEEHDPDDVKAFTKVTMPFGWLGNMAPYPVMFEGKVWKTTEALFQALRFKSDRIRELIRAEASPMGAKFVAKKHAACVAIKPTSDDDVRNMELVIKLKLEQHPVLKEALIETGEYPLIEDVTNRISRPGNHLFWGAARDDKGWRGHNILGQIWMRFRDELKKEAKACESPPSPSTSSTTLESPPTASK